MSAYSTIPAYFPIKASISLTQSQMLPGGAPDDNLPQVRVCGAILTPS
jgi:hypothetical protein